MTEATKTKRKLVDITLEEAIEVLRFGEGYSERTQYSIRTKTIQDLTFRQLCSVDPAMRGTPAGETVVANFSDSKNAIRLHQGNEYYRTHFRIIKYLEGRGFDLEAANSLD